MSRRLGLLAVGAIAAASVAVALPMASVSAVTVVVAHDFVDAPLPISSVSQAFAATSTTEFGDVVQLATGSRQLQSVTVGLVSFACQTGDYLLTNCATTRAPRSIIRSH